MRAKSLRSWNGWFGRVLPSIRISLINRWFDLHPRKTPKIANEKKKKNNLAIIRSKKWTLLNISAAEHMLSGIHTWYCWHTSPLAAAWQPQMCFSHWGRRKGLFLGFFFCLMFTSHSNGRKFVPFSFCTGSRSSPSSRSAFCSNLVWIGFLMCGASVHTFSRGTAN